MQAEPLRSRTLIIDDDPVVRRMFQRSLELAQFDVVVAASGEEGLRILDQDPTISLILLDLTMPGMDGWSFLQTQRDDPKIAEIPTVVVSGSTLATEEELGATAFLRKPVTRDHLLTVVSAFCKPRESVSTA